jgi:hypothetical protein
LEVFGIGTWTLVILKRRDYVPLNRYVHQELLVLLIPERRSIELTNEGLSLVSETSCWRKRQAYQISLPLFVVNGFYFILDRIGSAAFRTRGNGCSRAFLRCEGVTYCIHHLLSNLVD